MFTFDIYWLPRVSITPSLYNRIFPGRRPKTNKKNQNQKPDMSPPSTSTDLDTTKLATESSEHEVYITHFVLYFRSSHPRLFHQHHWHLLALLFCMVTSKLKKKQVREWSYFQICFPFLFSYYFLFTHS